MRFPHGVDVVVESTTSTPDRYGDTTTTTTERTIERCGFVPEHTTESHGFDQPALVMPAVLYVPAGEDPPTENDTIRLVTGRYAGRRYDVDGEPIDWTSPFSGHEFGFEVKLQRTG